MNGLACLEGDAFHRAIGRQTGENLCKLLEIWSLCCPLTFLLVNLAFPKIPGTSVVPWVVITGRPGGHCCTGTSALKEKTIVNLMGTCSINISIFPPILRGRPFLPRQYRQLLEGFFSHPGPKDEVHIKILHFENVRC